MSAPVDRGKSGSVGELHGRSIEELMEILERQEKLLDNKKFIAKLPDRGKKILDYTEKVRIAIAEHNRLKNRTDLLSAFALEFQEKQRNTKESTHITAVSQDKMAQAPTAVTWHTESTSIGANAAETNHTHEISSSSVPLNTNQETCKIDSDTAENTTNDLVNSLKMISITDSGEEINKGTSETSAKEKNSSYIVTTASKKSHYIEVVERREKNPIQKNEKFRTNRFASNSNGSTPNQSPGESALRMSVEERRIYDRKHLDDITAARLPPLHHLPAQLLPLEESLCLQIAQKQSYEETQGKLAAQKLLEKHNIKMGTFNPEGDSYIKIRDQRDDGNHDAEE
ncbi:protein GRINL1A [Mixophyes fleayi]|uniref:protein GRINL1A n=1 Tax=Mixophyes fleayi TaxID=3061075 RepID=UPI003F4DAB43